MEERINLVEGVTMKEKVTVKFIEKAIKLLRKVGVKEPYYVQVWNPKEGGDLLFKRVKKG